MKDVLFFIGFFATLLLVAFLIPALLAAGYLRARRKGRAPSAALVPLCGSAAGIFATDILAGKLSLRSYAFPLPGMWGLVFGSVLAMWFLIRIMPKRNPRVFGRRRPRFPFVTTGWALIAVGVVVCVFSFVSWSIGKVSSWVATGSLGVLASPSPLVGCSRSSSS